VTFRQINWWKYCCTEIFQ